MRTIQHWIAGSATTGASTRFGPVYHPATGAQQAPRARPCAHALPDRHVNQIGRDPARTTGE